MDRMAECIADADRIVREAIATHGGGHTLTAQVVLFSGGNDSTTLAHLMVAQGHASHAAHANTTIGVEATRQFVRDTSKALGLPLIERSGPQSYADLVLESRAFPGPAMHYRMYQRLKERALREVRREFVTNPRQQRVLFIAGRRRSESDRRAGIPEHERTGSIVWASPFANWTKADLDAYREHYAVPVNETAKALGMSGECLCGAFAEPGEFERIAEVDPDAALAIMEIEAALAEAGAEGPRCKWGWGAYRADPSAHRPKVGPLCSSCDDRWQPVRAAEPSPEVAAVLERRKDRWRAKV